MRRPRVRFTVLGAMIATAVLGVGMGGILLARRAEAYRLRGAEFARHEANSQIVKAKVDSLVVGLAGDPAGKPTRDAARTLEGFLLVVAGHEMTIQPAMHSRRFVPVVTPDRIATLSRLGPSATAFFSDMEGWNASLRRKYERAAARPWLPVDPDPPRAPRRPPRDIMADVTATVPPGRQGPIGSSGPG